MPVNKGMLVKVIGGLFDVRLSPDDRMHNMRYVQIRWSKGMLSSSGDWAWGQFIDYLEKYRELMSFSELQPLFENLSPDDVELLVYCVEHVKSDAVYTRSQFKHAVNYIEKEHNQVRFLTSMTQSLLIMQKGIKGKKGKVVKGFAPAKQFLIRQLRKLEEKGSIDSFANLKDARGLLLRTDEEQGKQDVILYGFEAIDNVTGGGQAGELALVAGYANEGKTQFLINVVWHAVVKQRKTVVVYSGEMSDEQYRRRLICRHSHFPKFGLAEGLPYDDVKFGRLDAEQQEKLKEVVEDFFGNPEYGTAMIHGLGKEDNVFAIWQSVESLGTVRVDLVAVDYLALVPPHRSRLGRREEMAETIRGMKTFAREAYRGEGVHILCAYQTNRQGRDRAEEQGFYDLQALEETAEAEKASDVIVWLLRTNELVEMNEVKVGIMKSRDSALLPEAYLFCDYASSYMADVAE